MTILVSGGRGQLGSALRRRGAAAPELDICDPAAVARSLDKIAPTVVVNAAAYTAVDRAESERDRAFAVNAEGAAVVAAACRVRRIRLLHISTDYVFDGTATQPYREDDPIAPVGVYGESKAAGERAMLDAGGIVVRTAWLFATGGAGFVQTILRLAAERTSLRVVADQIGSPTWADDLADAVVALAAMPALAPIYHYCGEPPVSRHALALAILDEARKHKPMSCIQIDPITTDEMPMPARRPPYSVLATDRIRALGIEPRPWHAGLAHVVAEELAR